MKSTRIFHVLFLIGLIILFVSLFLDFYYLQIMKDGDLVALFSYNLFTEWRTYPKSNTLTELLKPNNLEVPIFIPILFIFAIAVSGYGALMKPLEKQEMMEKVQKFVYLNVFILMISAFYILAFPIFYLLPNELYYPFLTITYQSGFVMSYSIGPGYILQLIGFIFIFPYTIFGYQTILKFKVEAQDPEKIINTVISTHQTSIDFDKLMAEEELTLRFEESPLKLPLIKKRRI